MAKNSNNPGDKKKKDKSDGLKSWLSTDDWLGVGADSVPIPIPKPEPVSAHDAIDQAEPASDGPGSMLPLGAERSEMAQMRPSETPSSARIAMADLAALRATPDPDSDDAIDLATPPDASLAGPPSFSKLRKASGAKSDILRGGPPSGDAADIHAGHITPTAPGSGWLGTRLPPKATGSQTDLGMPIGRTAPEEISDIFSGARHSDAGKDGTGSNLLPGMSGIGRSSVFGPNTRSGMGGESDLFGGLTGASGDRGSSVLDDSSERTQRVQPTTPGPGDIFRNPPAPLDDDGDPSGNVPLIDEDFFKDATVLDQRPLDLRTPGPLSSGKLARKLLEDLKAEGGASSGSSRPDYNATDKSASGSNLFDDVTALDIDLSSEPGASGVNWLDPNRTGAQDSGPSSSIFLKPNAEQTADGDRVDLGRIPMLGSTDDPADMVQNSDLAGPASSVLKKELDKTLREIAAEGGAVDFNLPDAGKITWGTPAATLEDQVSMRMPVSDDELDLAAPPSGSVVGKKKPKKESDSVFDDSPEFPGGSEIGLGELSGVLKERQSTPMSGSILQGMTSDKMRSPGVQSTPIPVTKKSRQQQSSQEFELLEPPAQSRGKAGWLGIAAALLLGTGAGAAGMYFGMPQDSAKPIVKSGEGGGEVAKADAAIATRLLNNGDPVAALEAFKAVSAESPEARAGRGQARWMAKLREVSAKGGKLAADDLDINAARADFKAVLDMADRLNAPEEKTALLKAALNMGLLLEATQKPEEAVKHYTRMAEQYRAQPNFKKVFDSAARRVFFAQRDGGNTKMTDDKYSLAPETLRELEMANFVLLEFEAVQPSIEEAGFHFWDAVYFASQHQYKNAIDSLARAREAHAKQRKARLGMGLNPYSDPTEQMFTRMCQELAFYYSFKGQVYDDGVVGAFARKNATRVTLEKMIAAFKQSDTIGTELAAERKRADSAVADAVKAIAGKTAAEKIANDAKAEVVKLQDDAKADKGKLDQNRKALQDATDKLAAAESKLKQVDAAIDAVIAKLKETKLIDDKAARNDTVAALPELVKKPGFMAAGTGTNTEMAKELVAVREAAKKEKDEAEKKIKDLTDLTKDATAKLNAAVKAAEAKSQEQLTALRNELDQAKLQAERERKQGEAKVAAQAVEFQSKIAAARAGASVTVTDIERDAQDQAARAYATGLEHFAVNRFNEAEAWFNVAVQKHANDARYWYYLGLAKARQGRDASADFASGAKLEARGLPNAAAVNSDITRVQGALRQSLDAARP
jgi:hypothetical protein